MESGVTIYKSKAMFRKNDLETVVLYYYHVAAHRSRISFGMLSISIFQHSRNGAYQCSAAVPVHARGHEFRVISTCAHKDADDDEPITPPVLDEGEGRGDRKEAENDSQKIKPTSAQTGTLGTNRERREHTLP